jgi:ssRNA-specific RNase YbeY (16S rRNA maturation enzyme)
VVTQETDPHDRMDLLTVFEHELGHLLGYDHEEGGVMEEMVSAGTRESAWDQFSEVDSAIADWFFAKEKSPMQRKSS